MKSYALLQACLVLVVGLLAGCDFPMGSNPVPTDEQAATSLVGVWTSPTDVITLGSDGKATDLDSETGSSTVRFRYQGTWSISGGDLSLDFPRVDSSTNGITWFQVPCDANHGRTVPFTLHGNTLILDTGSGTTTYTRTVSGSGTTVGAVSAPVFSAPSGTYPSAQWVTISCATSGVAIYYTQDGSYPTTSSWRYIGAIQVISNTTLRAVAISTYGTSSVSSVEYTIQPGGPSTSGALVGIWKGIFGYTLSGYYYRDTVEFTLYSGGSLYWTRNYRETDPTYGDVLYDSQSASGTWSATATQLTLTVGGSTDVGTYSLNGNALTIVDAHWTPVTRTFQRQ